ncbi:PssD/Cps14F family polysaccharide biosynthesis glycosyltransferase [Cyclobacterium sp. 1_MG-2023]|uniref:PssD/Cps14F family polysaccharide biosynthesis glycosyltransferase n=1 Tax=Cyclobacterium sp. 1_MG-2023 TaxID=3062681 RepID=UPI0026E11D81|nr:PssD/Cps14F family polysaccharide biosynthesis glycosyltransferase [Cyclobacterium sp. 1_MG-2023]MDO6436257.1 PssD/Cps14F family polysaccharide biosynthesis glycosyltransferase [Cyclobacterium sp. 1_MG-2023]
MKPKVILLIYGSGGHKAQMEKLLIKINKEYEEGGVSFIGITESEASILHPDIIETFEQPPFRNKYFSFINLFSIPRKYYNFISCFSKINKKYKVLSVISTGPGLAIPFSLLFKIKKTKIVFIETWSRFETQSYAGKVMYKIADKFYIQNRSLFKFYPKAIYSGLL